MGFSRQEYWSGVPLPSPIQRMMGYKCSKVHLLSGAAHSMRTVLFSFQSCVSVLQRKRLFCSTCLISELEAFCFGLVWFRDKETHPYFSSVLVLIFSCSKQTKYTFKKDNRSQQHIPDEKQSRLPFRSRRLRETKSWSQPAYEANPT